MPAAPISNLRTQLRMQGVSVMTSLDQSFNARYDRKPKGQEKSENTCQSCNIAYLCTEFCIGCGTKVCFDCAMPEKVCCLVCSKTKPSQHEESCTNCGSACATTQQCYSCAGIVCDMCLPAKEACCILCVETFPASPYSSCSFQSNILERFTHDVCGPPAIDAHEAMCRRTSLDSSSRLTTCSGSDDGSVSKESCPRTCSKGSDSTSADEDSTSPTDVTEGTTMMIQNIPCRLQQSDLIDSIHANGFVNKYDFVYVPSGRYKNRTKGNLGYAFVNFKNMQQAEEFAVKFDSFQFEGTTSTKKCTLKYAHRQGFNGRKDEAKGLQK